MPVIPATWKAEIGGSWFKGSAGKKVSATLTQSWVQWGKPIMSALKRHREEDHSLRQPQAKKCETLPQN
jgi:hypothetical protein